MGGILEGRDIIIFVTAYDHATGLVEKVDKRVEFIEEQKSNLGNSGLISQSTCCSLKSSFSHFFVSSLHVTNPQSAPLLVPFILVSSQKSSEHHLS